MESLKTNTYHVLSIQKDSGRPLLFPVSPGKETGRVREVKQPPKTCSPGSSELATPVGPQQEEFVGGPSPSGLASSKFMNFVADGDLPSIN